MLTPVALWGLEVPPNGMPVLVGEDIPLNVNVTMAAIDPSAEVADKKKPQLATLRLLRRKIDPNGDFDSDSEEEDSEDEEEEKPAAKKGKKADAGSEKMDVDEEDEESDEEDDEDYLATLEEFVVCTLDATKTYQQPLSLHINENEIVFFKNTGAYTVYLTGNYVVNDEEGGSDSEGDSDSEDDYDLSPDEDDLVAPYDSEEESDELDDLEDPRITEVDSEEEKKEQAKKEKKAAPVAGKKRAAEEESPKKAADAKAEEPKLSKKQQKKLKANDGKPVEAPATATPTKDAKKVKFAAQLEQGPTPSKSTPSKTEKEKAKPEAKSPSTASGPRKVQGITIEDKTVGSGPAAKAGSKLKMRYVGKLLNGKQFDANTSGKPFSFVLGKGQVIKGWDVGLMGIQAGGERKLVIPAESAYGKKGVPGIPGNSTLVFEVKALAVN